MLRVGLTGGLASGKSFVGHALESLGCHLIEADELGHQVLLPGAEAFDSVVGEFGPGILDPQGLIDRRKLASLVFGKPALLEKLNSFVHPAVFARQDHMLDGFQESDPHGIAVVAAAIMVETGSYKKLDRLIVAVCTLEQQIERAMKRDSLTREEVMTRIARQLPLEEKVRLADYVIDTSGSKDRTVEQVREVYRSLRDLGA
jgi:dephospho-CoA kinase